MVKYVGEKNYQHGSKEKTGVFLGAYAINPVNGEEIPIWVADYVLMSYGTGAIMAVPGHDQRDYEFAKNFNLPIQIFRLSGIYSNENNVINRLKMGTLKIVNKNNHFFSRIHIEDIAAVLSLSLKKFNPGEIYNISDNYPCSNEEIAKYAANLINMNLPKRVNIEDLESEMLLESLFELYKMLLRYFIL